MQYNDRYKQINKIPQEHFINFLLYIKAFESAQYWSLDSKIMNGVFYSKAN